MRASFAALLLCVVTSSASAQTSDVQADDEQTNLHAIAHGMIEGHILPGYATLAGIAYVQSEAVDALCAAPSSEALASAQGRFADLVEAWSAVEFIRFGPARDDNRYERLFFWPDRNGRGLNQVQAAIASQDETVTSVESLQGKSVALQGLLALEYTLFGTDADTLAGGNGHRCAYASAIAGAIADTSQDVLDGWMGEDGYAALMLSPGPDNPIYRSDAEVLRELLRSMAEQVQIVHDFKLVRVVGTSTADARARRAPLWRSDQTIAMIIANAEAMLSLNEAGRFAELLPPDSVHYALTLRFELGQTVSRLQDLQGTGLSLDALVTSDETHGRLASVAFPLAGAMRVLGEVYPAELGLTMGFNSLDGD